MQIWLEACLAVQVLGKTCLLELVFPAVSAQVLPLFQPTLFGLALVLPLFQLTLFGLALVQAFLVGLVLGMVLMLADPAELDQGPPLLQAFPAVVQELFLQVSPSGLVQGQPFLLHFLSELDLVLIFLVVFPAVSVQVLLSHQVVPVEQLLGKILMQAFLAVPDQVAFSRLVFQAGVLLEAISRWIVLAGSGPVEPFPFLFELDLATPSWLFAVCIFCKLFGL